MKNAKKLLALLLATAMLFALCACGDDSKKDSSKDNKKDGESTRATTTTTTYINNFMIAGSEDDPNEIFSVDVWEKTPAEDKDQDGHDYGDFLPGDLLLKEAHVENTGSYDQYIRVTVTISDAQAWIAALGADFDVSDIFVGFDSARWNHMWNNLSENPNADEIVYVMYYNDILPADEDVTVFTHVQIPVTLDAYQLPEFAGNFSITVQADAVQTANVVPEGTAPEDAAWAAFKTVEG